MYIARVVAIRTRPTDVRWSRSGENVISLAVAGQTGRMNLGLLVGPRAEQEVMCRKVKP